MDWLKTVILDIAVTLMILVAVTTDINGVDTIVVVYTPIMLVLKLVEAFGQGMINNFRPAAPQPPAWFIHLLYGVNTMILLAASWWWTSLQWAAIWMLSFLSHRSNTE